MVQRIGLGRHGWFVGGGGGRRVVAGWGGHRRRVLWRCCLGVAAIAVAAAVVAVVVHRRTAGGTALRQRFPQPPHFGNWVFVLFAAGILFLVHASFGGGRETTTVLVVLRFNVVVPRGCFPPRASQFMNHLAPDIGP